MLRFFVLGSALLALAVPSSASGQVFKLGLYDDVFLSPERDAWLDKTVDSGASMVRLGVSWRAVASTRPADASNPSDPNYRFVNLDESVSAASERGLAVLLAIGDAPIWAEGAGRPSSAAPGSWRPDPEALGDFARALALRYSGTFAGLPRVHRFQIWNEPNLPRYLAPQWSRIGRRLAPAAARQYRRMLAEAYRGIKSAQPSATVVTAGTAPFGDPQPGGRTPPAQFLRGLLCLNTQLRAEHCARRASFDVLAHHPYSVGGPSRRALNRDDVSIPDLGKLKRILQAGARAGTVRPPGRKPIWVTEVGYDSSPPDPAGVPSARHARWLEEALYILWRQGVSQVTWSQIRDQEPNPSFAATNQAGLFLRDGTPKAAALAFKFPFVVSHSRGGTRVWGKAPREGEVVIEQRGSRTWRVFHRVAARAGSSLVFSVRLPPSSAALRARQGRVTSTTWPRVGP